MPSMLQADKAPCLPLLGDRLYSLGLKAIITKKQRSWRDTRSQGTLPYPIRPRWKMPWRERQPRSRIARSSGKRGEGGKDNARREEREGGKEGSRSAARTLARTSSTFELARTSNRPSAPPHTTHQTGEAPTAATIEIMGVNETTSSVTAVIPRARARDTYTDAGRRTNSKATFIIATILGRA